MNKLIFLSVVVGGLIYAGMHGQADNLQTQSNVEKYSWVAGDDDFQADAGRRRGKGHRGRRRGGSGLR